MMFTCINIFLMFANILLQVFLMFARHTSEKFLDKNLQPVVADSILLNLAFVASIIIVLVINILEFRYLWNNHRLTVFYSITAVVFIFVPYILLYLLVKCM